MTIKTFVGILEEFSKKNACKQPDYNQVGDVEKVGENSMVRSFCFLRLLPRSTLSSPSFEHTKATVKRRLSRSEPLLREFQNAKHLAAREILLKMVKDDNKHEILGLGEDKQAATEFL